jgi:hypothetical protein
VDPDGFGVLPLGMKKRDQVVNGSDGFGPDSWRLGPIGAMKNVGAANKKFNGKNMEFVPEPMKKGQGDFVSVKSNMGK